MNSLCIYLGEGKGGCTNTCICIGTHNQPFLQNHLMDVYETCLGGGYIGITLSVCWSVHPSVCPE